MNLRISIITVVHNAREDFKLTAQTVKDQNYDNIEYLVIDGGSTDGTLEVIKSNQDFITKYVSEPDQGIYDAMNRGMKMATGDWVLFLNAGDVFCDDNVLENIFTSSVRESAKILYGNFYVVHKNGSKKLLHAKKFNRLNLMLWGTRVVCHQAFFVRRDIALQYNLKFKFKAEFDSYFKLLRKVNKYEISKIDLPIVNYQLGGLGDQNLTLNLKEQISVLIEHSGVLFILGLPVICYKFIWTKIFRR